MTQDKTVDKAVSDLHEARTRLEAELAQVNNALRVLAGRTTGRHAPQRPLSAAGRAAISKAARKRWAAWHREQRKAGK